LHDLNLQHCGKTSLVDFTLEEDPICALTSSKGLGFLITCVIGPKFKIQFASTCSMENTYCLGSWSFKDVI
jgi:hypothetical protein